MNWIYPIIGGLIGYATNWLAIKMVTKWLIPRRQEEIKKRIVNEIIPKFLPGYLWSIPVIKREFLQDTAKLVNEVKVTELANIILSGSKELLFIKILGGVIGAVAGVVLLLLA